MNEQPDTRLAEESGGGAARPLSSEGQHHRGAVDFGGLLIAAALVVLAFLIFSDAWSYPVRRASAHFGPGIFPMIVAGGLLVLGILTVLMGVRGRFPEREVISFAAPAWITGGLLVQVLLIANGGGFVLAATALFSATARGFGHRNFLVSVPAGLVVATFLYVLFQRLLGLALPAGPLEAAINALFL